MRLWTVTQRANWSPIQLGECRSDDWRKKEHRRKNKKVLLFLFVVSDILLCAHDLAVINYLHRQRNVAVTSARAQRCNLGQTTRALPNWTEQIRRNRNGFVMGSRKLWSEIRVKRANHWWNAVSRLLRTLDALIKCNDENMQVVGKEKSAATIFQEENCSPRINLWRIVSLVSFFFSLSFEIVRTFSSFMIRRMAKVRWPDTALSAGERAGPGLRTRVLRIIRAPTFSVILFCFTFSFNRDTIQPFVRFLIAMQILF